MVAMNFVSRQPNSPFLNEAFYVVWGFGGATFTGAYTSIASTVEQVIPSGASYVSLYRAGSVATGTWTVKGYVVKGTDGTFSHSATIQIRNSEIADPAKTVYDILKDNVGSSYAAIRFSTGWYSHTLDVPQVTVTRDSRSDETWNLGDTMRRHEESLAVDAWSTGTAFGQTSDKHTHTLLNDEVKRIINANRFEPSTKLKHMQIARTQYLPEITDNRRIHRTRHSLRILWSETIG